jgi:hypothetical protein
MYLVTLFMMLFVCFAFARLAADLLGALFRLHISITTTTCHPIAQIGRPRKPKFAQILKDKKFRVKCSRANSIGR